MAGTAAGAAAGSVVQCAAALLRFPWSSPFHSALLGEAAAAASAAAAAAAAAVEGVEVPPGAGAAGSNGVGAAEMGCADALAAEAGGAGGGGGAEEGSRERAVRLWRMLACAAVMWLPEMSSQVGSTEDQLRN